jgi:hypothetical protein
VTNEQKLEMANAGKRVLVHLQAAMSHLHSELDMLVVEKAVGSLMGDAATMIHNEITERCKL